MMTSQIKISLIAGVAALVVLVVSVTGCVNLSNQGSTKTYSQENPLVIPPLIDSREAGNHIELVMQDGEHEFFSGVKSATKGFSQSYLGPTIRLYKGETTQISFKNEIDESTTVHGHGLHVEGRVDGGPQGKILAGETKDVVLPIVQEAGTSWYHPHLKGKTADHVHAGLAGFYLIEDENSQTLPLPREYGMDDIPLVVQDRTFVDGEMQPFAVTNNQVVNGLREETLVVNGTINAHHTVPAGWVRLRLLNGSNARFYRFFFANDEPIYKIATEGGFLNRPVTITELTMAPGERNEVMIDLSGHASLSLMAEFLPTDPEGVELGDVDSLVEFGEYLRALFPQKIPVQRVLELRTDATLPVQGSLPDKLNDIDYFSQDDQQDAVKRTFNLDMDMADDAGPINEQNQLSINLQPMDMNVINERVKKGDLELWTITAETMPHPFHVHGVSFQILTHNGQPTAEQDRGWKDTVIVTEEPTEILMRFNHTATNEFPYMIHCHILEHEDNGMMGQFTVMN